MFDVAADGDGVSGRRAGAARRLVRLDRPRYGDRVSIDEPRGYESAGARRDVARVAADYGLLLADGAPVTEGAVPPGIDPRRRQPLQRERAGLPELDAIPASNSPVRTGTNYGCATNSNLAAMIANPDDLVRGRDGFGQRHRGRPPAARSGPIAKASRPAASGLPANHHDG